MYRGEEYWRWSLVMERLFRVQHDLIDDLIRGGNSVTNDLLIGCYTAIERASKRARWHGVWTIEGGWNGV